MNKKILLMLILSIFFGCSPIPKITKNEIITPNDISTGTFENQKLIFSNTNWWKIYNDPVLNQLIDFTLKENEDLISLITCTPYGINTHRLVVTGERVPFDKEEYENIDKKVMSFREIAFTIIPLALLGLVIGLKVKDKKINKVNKRN